MSPKLRSKPYELNPALAAVTVLESDQPKVLVAQTTATDMVLFRLMKLSNLMTKPFFTKFAKKYSMTFTEWFVLAVLASKPGIAAQDISVEIGLSAMNVSRALKGLRRSAMVREARDPENHRRTLLWLSSRGIETFNEVTLHGEKVAKPTLEVLTAEEIRTLRLIVNKLIDRLEIITS